MIEMDKDYMLIATFNGLFRLDKETLNPSHVLSPQTEEEGTLNHFSIYSLYKDKQNILWVGTNAGGVNFLSSLQSTFQNDPSQSVFRTHGDDTQGPRKTIYG